VKNLDEFQYPGRRPWLLLVVVVLIAALLVARYEHGKRGAGTRESVQAPAPAAAVQAAAPVAAAVQATPRVAAAPAVSAVAASTPKPAPPVMPPAQPLPLAVCTQALAEAAAHEREGRLAEARGKYESLMEKAVPTQVLTEAQERLGSVNARLALTPRPMSEKTDYIVKRGDSVDRIARKFGTTVNLVQKSNDISKSGVIRPGDRLRILTGRFSIVVSKSRKELVLRLNDRFFKSYAVGTGRHDLTPAGAFRVSDKIVEPPWDRPDGAHLPYGHPENILGSRWMALRATGDTPDLRGYGIHGTTNDGSIGKAESAGCVRMRNADVEELFDFVPVGTAVKIEE